MEWGGTSNDELAQTACDRAHPQRPEAFDELFRRLKAWSMEVARAAGAQGDIEDVVIEAWIRLWRLGRLDTAKGSSFKAYMRPIVRNVTRDLAPRARPPLPPDGQPGPNPVSAAVAAVQEAFDDLRSAHPSWAEVLHLLAVEDLPYAAVADRLQIAIGQVGQRATYGRIFIAEKLAARAYASEPPAQEPGFVLVKDVGAQAAARLHGFQREHSFAGALLFSFMPGDGQFVLPESDQPGGAACVCKVFHLTLWVYDLGAFAVLAPGEAPATDTPVVFSRGGWRVVRHPDDSLQRDEP